MQHTQKVPFKHLTTVFTSGTVDISQLHNEHVLAVGTERQLFSYSTLLYGLYRRISSEQYAHYQLGMKTLRVDTHSRAHSLIDTSTQPAIVMAFAKPSITSAMQRRRSYNRYFCLSACLSIVDNVSLANYSVYHNDDIDVAFYIRFSDYSGFQRVLQDEMDIMRRHMSAVFTQDDGRHTFLCNAKIVVYRGRNGVSLSFVSDNQSALLAPEYTRILKQCGELYNTMHFMGLDAFYRNNGRHRKSNGALMLLQNV